MQHLKSMRLKTLGVRLCLKWGDMPQI
ncbi:unnamed protein product [Lathyrus oleraceus]